jgi:hypothetical protein
VPLSGRSGRRYKAFDGISELGDGASSRGHYVFRHTTTVHSQISQAREAIGLVWTYLDAFQQAADRMINEALSIHRTRWSALASAPGTTRPISIGGPSRTVNSLIANCGVRRTCVSGHGSIALGIPPILWLVHCVQVSLFTHAAPRSFRPRRR